MALGAPGSGLQGGLGPFRVRVAVTAVRGLSLGQVEERSEPGRGEGGIGEIDWNRVTSGRLHYFSESVFSSIK